jgi:hypothetical protein
MKEGRKHARADEVAIRVGPRGHAAIERPAGAEGGPRAPNSGGLTRAMQPWQIAILVHRQPRP